jgi:SAM-dependent methyltransferase
MPVTDLSESTRVNSAYSLWRNVIPLPTGELMKNVGAPTIENFLVVCDAWRQVIARYARPGATILDIGCGCGRLARVLAYEPWIRRYIGFDVSLPQIEWCRNYISPLWTGVAEFHYFDVYSAEYNPSGQLKGHDVKFPCTDIGADIILAASVFTHLLEPDAIRYLSEVSRTLSPRGTALLSIHVEPPPGKRFHGAEGRIDIDPGYFLELANAAGLCELESSELCGQQVCVFQRAAGPRSAK